ncbi:MAG: N-formylglutamate amidohydrolase [Alphaproteobacteria bacterium]|nr:N-formylglutamate amidohydrolase [Alphaproteobacteria bacterium]
MTAIVLSCEHASPRVPAGVHLGLSAEVMASHVAWDPGALPLAEALALELGAPLLAGQVSRLVCDLHRRESHPDCTRAEAWGVVVPGNVDLSPAAREARLAAFHRPWRRALEAEVERALREGGRCLHLSLHSFTPHLPHGERDLDVGVLFREDRPWTASTCEALLGALHQAGFDARANQPYGGLGEATTTWFEERLPPERYAGIELELSQALPAAALPRLLHALLPPLREA